ncbi:MAG: bifunctional serine/threonine-protein kinase/formylglycine-generating enzyme family protein [Planctomycetota bacterium]
MGAEDESRAGEGRERDEEFARSALEKGLLDESEIEQCRREQARLAESGERRPLAEIAAQKTLITQSQADRLDAGSVPGTVPKRVANYEIVRQIGEGGMGTVYKVRHVKLESFAAAKFLPSRLAEDESFVKRFEREARLAAKLTSPFSVRTFDVGEAEGARCIFMEYVEGESVDDLLRREGRMDEKRALKTVRDIASALDEAHDLGIIHRDIKPGNILLTRRGAPKLADLGLAKDVDGGQGSLTSMGTILGTPSYMSPEQAMGLPDLDARSDIYSLGATLYRMVCGDVPFRGETPVNVMHKIATEPLIAPLERNPSLSDEAAAMICKMMAKDRKERYQSMAELLKDIDSILSGEKTNLKYEKSVALLNPGARGLGPTPPTAVAPGRKRRRTKVVLGAAAGIVALAAAAVVLGPWGKDHGPEGAGGPPKEIVSPSEGPAEKPSTGMTEPDDDETPTPPTETAAMLIAKADKAAAGGQWDEARMLAQSVLDRFPGAGESARAKALLDQVDQAAREQALAELARAATEAEPLAASARLAEAEKKRPGDERLAKLRATVDARLAKSHDTAVAEASAAEAKGDYTAAVAAYERALKFRPSPSTESKLKTARLRLELLNAGKESDPSARLLALAAVLQKGGDGSTKPVQAGLQELIGVRRQAVTARQHAEKFRDQMPAGVKAGFALAEEKCSRAEKALASLDPLTMTEAGLRAIAADLAAAHQEYEKASSQTFDVLYAALDKQLSGPDFAAGLMRLHSARTNYEGYRRVAELVGKHDAGGAGLAIIEIVAPTKTVVDGYASPKEAADACKKLDAVWARCEALKPAKDAERKTRSLKGLVLSRRAVAREAAGDSLGALADVAAATELTGKPKAFESLLAAAAAHTIGKLGEELKAGRGPEFVGKIGATLEGPTYASARAVLGKSIRSAPYAFEFTRNRGLVEAWSRTVAPFEPPAMAAIPAGTFPLGVKYDGLVTLAPSNSPQHAVKLPPFFIDTHEVTNGEYLAFVQEGGYADDRWWPDLKDADRKAFVDTTGKPSPKFWKDGRPAAGTEALPVVGVSFHEARAYARWAGKRLPTEAEWECAALAVTPEDPNQPFAKHAFPWGEKYVDGNANVRETNVGGPEPVGQRAKDRSPFGCFDMVGNVREWTASPYAAYPGTKCGDKDLGTGLVVVRGASFADSFIGAAPENRRAVGKLTREEQTGFRCAWSLATEKE